LANKLKTTTTLSLRSSFQTNPDKSVSENVKFRSQFSFPSGAGQMIVGQFAFSLTAYVGHVGQSAM